MSHARRWLILALILLALVLIGVNLTRNTDEQPPLQTDLQPDYQSEHARTLVYNPQGALSYRLVAQHVEYFSRQQISLFREPLMTVFNSQHQPAWTVRADRAKLTKDKMLYLHGDVRVTALIPDAQLQEIATDAATVNLVSQDIASDDRVTLSGPGLSSTGLKMRGNLRDKTAQLIEQVKTSYETQSTPPAH